MKYLVFEIVLSIGTIFLFSNSVLAVETGVVINEIMVGSTTDTKMEFIELYNNSDADINLTDYSLKKKNSTGAESNLVAKSSFTGNILAHNYFLITPPEHVEYFNAELVYSGASYSITADNTVLLYKNDVLVDKVGYGTAFDFELFPVISFNNSESIERVSIGNDSDNNQSDFIVNLNPSPKGRVLFICGNGIKETGEGCDDGNLINSDGCDAQCKIESSSEENNSGIVINEFVSDPEIGSEWIELYNFSDVEIDLTGWTLSDGASVFKTFGEYDSVAGKNFFVYELASNKLNNLGDIIILKNSDGIIIDQVTYGNWNDGDLTNNATKATDPNATARKIDGSDTGVDNVDFAVTASLTPGEPNEIEAPPSTSTGGSRTTIIIETPAEMAEVENITNYNPSDLVINELVSDPTDGENEWIEIYNNTSNQISLDDWTIEDGSEAVSNLTGNISAKGFYVLEKPKGSLNNGGDLVILKAPDGEIIDQITYGNWDDDDLTNNAPAVGDPKSLARKVDGSDSNNDFNDFISASPTKGLANKISEVIKISSSVRLNEILPNPKGDDTETEFIELYNFSDQEVDLSGWKLGDSSTKRYTIGENTKIKSDEYLVFYRAQTGIALNNSGQEKVILLTPDGQEIDSAQYSGSVKEDSSYSFFENAWQWTMVATAEKKNVLNKLTENPKATIDGPEEIVVETEVTFDASDSNDPLGSKLEYQWKLGSEIVGKESILKHIFDKVGQYQLTLEVKNAEGLIGQTELKIDVVDDFGESLALENKATESGDIYLSEILPNPVGSDTEGEWIEICATIDTDLKDFKLDDIEGGSPPYLIKDTTPIKAGQCLVFERPITGLALNNTNESVRLIDPTGKIIEEIKYEKSQEGASFAVDSSGSWYWTKQISKGEINPLNAEIISTETAGINNGVINKVALAEVKNLPNESLVQVEGLVAVEPGILGSQLFYLAGSGIQIYMYNKEFPDLALGDYIEVTGLLTESGGERRIKLKQKDDIIILEKQRQIPEPHVVTIDQIDESFEGALIIFEGNLIEKSGSSLFVDDGTEEIKVYLKTSAGITLPKLTEGTRLKITGILSETKNGYQVLPRYADDIQILSDGAADVSGDIGKIAEVATNQRQEDMIKYLIITIVILMTALITSMLNNRLARKKDLSIDR